MPNAIQDLHTVDDVTFPYVFEQNAAVRLKSGSLVCRYYIGAVDDYPKDLRLILIETSTLKTLLENLKFLIDTDGGPSPILKSLGAKEGPIAGC